MGVHGLWKLIEPSGTPVPLETLENKVLAVDVSIWLHQAIKGFQDSKGAPLPNAHLLGIYHRVCKLLYFKIKPVFVFDGGVPVLKKETIAKRNQLKAKHVNDANKLQKQILTTLLKHTAVNKVLSEQTKAILPVKIKPGQEQENDNLYKLPPSQLDSTISSSEDEDYSTDSSPTKYWDMHTVDVKSTQFRSLPADVRHEILTDLKETRKQSSWGRIHELPTESNDFAHYQMNRLLKRFSIQSSLEDAEKEMGGHSLSLGELESLLNDHGVVTEESIGDRIASDENTRFLYIKDVKKALEKARVESMKPISEEVEAVDVEELTEESDFQQDLNLAIQLSLQDTPSTSKDSIQPSSSKESTSKDPNNEFKQASSSKDCVKPSSKNLQIFSAAKGYMMEYSGLTPAGINAIITGSKPTDTHSSDSATKAELNKLISIESAVLEIHSPEIDQSIRNNDEIQEQNTAAKESHLPEDSDELEISAIEETVKKNLDGKPNIESRQVGELKSASTEIFLPKSANELNGNDTSVEGAAEFMSDSGSESSGDFLEVPEDDESPLKSVKESQIDIISPGKKVLEVVIDVESNLEDDIFSDVFDEPKKQEINKTIILKKLTENLNIIRSRNKDITEENANKQGISKSEGGEARGISGEGKGDEARRISEVGEAKGISNESQSERKDVAITSVLTAEEVIKANEHVEIVPSLTTEELRRMELDLENEKRNLIVERSNKERLANNITDQMYQEAQELLQLFGVPYIVAPMEAEAQCAFLNEASLSDGTITDDSDIWLFGGKTVYKNFFNQSKRVMEFRAESIEHHFNLSRQKLIQLSLLVGSDYTVGLQGIGPVTALEILAAFPSYNENAAVSYQQVISGLIQFRSWFNKGRIAGPSKTSLRTKLKNLQVTESFPSTNVVRAYLEPEVETSKERFSWGRPDIVALTDFAKEKFGWTQKKSEEILKPVIKRLEESKVQGTIKDYFKTKHKIDVTDLTEKMSKRVKTAVVRMGKDPNAEESIIAEKKPRARKTRKEPEPGEPVAKKPATRKPRARNIKKIAGETKVTAGNSKKIPDETKTVADETEAIPGNTKTTTGDGSKDFTTLEIDEDLLELQRVEMASSGRVQEIEDEINRELERNAKRTLHKKDVIPQKERDKSELVNNKMKAIEAFRKSKKGPGYVRKRARVLRKPKDDAELSESSSD